MGNKFSRRRETPVNSAEGGASEQKAIKEPETAQPEVSGTTQTNDEPEVVIGETEMPVARLPSEPCVSECKATEAPDASAPPGDAEPEPVAKESPAETEPVVSVGQTEAPEPTPQEEPTPSPEAVVEADPEPAPAEALEKDIELLTQESIPIPGISSPSSDDPGAPDVTTELVDTLPSSAAIPEPIKTEESVNITEPEGSQGPAESLMPEQEKAEDMSESLEKPLEEEAAGDLEKQAGDLTEDRVSGLLADLELTGNDVVAELIESGVRISDDTDIVDISASTDLM